MNDCESFVFLTLLDNVILLKKTGAFQLSSHRNVSIVNISFYRYNLILSGLTSKMRILSNYIKYGLYFIGI